MSKNKHLKILSKKLEISHYYLIIFSEILINYLLPYSSKTFLPSWVKKFLPLFDVAIYHHQSQSSYRFGRVTRPESMSTITSNLIRKE